jgi:hypothetical protein
MNLHSLVAPAIAAINPFVPITVQVSIGATSNPNSSRTPTYEKFTNVSAQVQQLTAKDIAHLDGLNIQGSMRKIYVNGNIDAIVRFNQKGGDLITMPDGVLYLTTAVLERWPDWCAVSITLQNPKPVRTP